MNAEPIEEPSPTPADYVRHGWSLVPIRRGSKGPRKKGWNRRENCITSPALASAWHGNVGLALAYSGLCTIDFDRLDDATSWLSVHGIDATSLLNSTNAVRISSGRPNRAKLLYQLPTALPSLALADAALELRCADNNGLTTKQDLLPPSLHPSGQTYKWEYPEPMIGDWRSPPMIPTSLLALWKSELRARVAPSAELPIYASRMGLHLTDLATLLAPIDPDISYDSWHKVLMAVHHETGGSEAGLQLVSEWSARGRKYRGDRDVLTHWRSFKTDRANVVGAAWLQKFAREQTNSISDSTAKRFQVISDHQFVDRVPLAWHVKGILPKAELAVIYGPSGSGKSFLVFDMVAAIANGIPWLERKTTKGRAVFVLAEGATGFRNRLLAYEKTHGGYPGVKIIDHAPNLLGDQDHALLAREIEASGGADLIVIDTLAASSPGADENAAKDMGKVIDHCKQLHRLTAATVLLIHHSGKDESKGARGWSGLRAAADAEMEVSRNNEYRMMEVKKLKDGEDGSKFTFKLVPVEIDIDADGEAVVSCVVEQVPAIPTHSKPDHRRHGPIERAVLDAMRDNISADGSQSVACIIEALAAGQPKPKGRDTRKQHLRRAFTTLSVKGLIVIEGDQCRLA